MLTPIAASATQYRHVSDVRLKLFLVHILLIICFFFYFKHSYIMHIRNVKSTWTRVFVSLTLRRKTITALSFSPDGKFLVTGEVSLHTSYSDLFKEFRVYLAGWFVPGCSWTKCEDSACFIENIAAGFPLSFRCNALSQASACMSYLQCLSQHALS